VTLAFRPRSCSRSRCANGSSSIAAIGLVEGGLADETTTFNLFDVANPYILTKWQSERIAMRFAESGLPVVVVNPAFPFGPRDIAPTPTGGIIRSLLAKQVPLYILGRIGRGPGGIKVFDKRALAQYVHAFRDPRTIHATCEDYRAAAGIDLVHDKKDLKRKIRMPVLVLWGRQGVIERMFDPIRDWREVARDVRGRALDCGHFLPEEKPIEVLRELRRFLAHG